jgi:hypothetical protein
MKYIKIYHMACGQTIEGQPIEMTEEEYKERWENLKQVAKIDWSWCSTSTGGRIAINKNLLNAIELKPVYEEDLPHLGGAL